MNILESASDKQACTELSWVVESASNVISRSVAWQTVPSTRHSLATNKNKVLQRYTNTSPQLKQTNMKFRKRDKGARKKAKQSRL